MTRQVVVVGLLSTLVLATPIWAQDASETGDGEAWRKVYDHWGKIGSNDFLLIALTIICEHMSRQAKANQQGQEDANRGKSFQASLLFAHFCFSFRSKPLVAHPNKYGLDGLSNG